MGDLLAPKEKVFDPLLPHRLEEYSIGSPALRDVEEVQARPGAGIARLVPFSAKSKHAGKVRDKLGNQTAQAIMKTDLITIHEKAEIDSAISLMTEHVIKRLPVVDDQGIFKGMISREVLLKEGFSAMKEFIGNG